MVRALVDTGAVVALVNRGDRHHTAATEWFRAFRGQLLTTDAVVTETAYVLAPWPSHLQAALIWFDRARQAGLLRVALVEDYSAIGRILEQYSSLPCDYADASLIDLAERTGVTAIATVDQRDFSVYRIKGRKRFQLLLA